MLKTRSGAPRRAPPETRSPAPAGTGDRAGLKVQGRTFRQPRTYHSPEAVAKAFPAAARHLSLYDGRTFMGVVIDLEGRREAHAFDDQDRPLGSFGNRMVAFGAVRARFRHERDGGGL